MGTKIPPETCEEHMKLEQCRDAYESIRHFMAWLQERKYVLGYRMDGSRTRTHRVTCSLLTPALITEAIYSYFDINPHKLREEYKQLKESGDEYQSPVEES